MPQPLQSARRSNSRTVEASAFQQRGPRGRRPGWAARGACCSRRRAGRLAAARAPAGRIPSQACTALWGRTLSGRVHLKRWQPRWGLQRENRIGQAAPRPHRTRIPGAPHRYRPVLKQCARASGAVQGRASRAAAPGARAAAPAGAARAPRGSSAAGLGPPQTPRRTARPPLRPHKPASMKGIGRLSLAPAPGRLPSPAPSPRGGGSTARGVAARFKVRAGPLQAARHRTRARSPRTHAVRQHWAPMRHPAAPHA
jgi:hypothetical protein